MRVTLSVGGKFQAFHLAQELERHGCLFRLLTTYFGHNAKNMAIDRARVLTNALPELLMRVPRRVPVLNRFWEGDMLKFESFDRWASQHIDGSDLVAAWSGFALTTLQRARAMGIKTVLERASTHCVFQREVLEEEYARQGISGRVDRRLEERGTEEYASADSISVPSRFAMETFLARGVSPEKIFVTPFGVNPAEFRRIPKEDRKFRVLFVGSGSLRKGLHYLLEAVHPLRLRDFEVWIIAGITDEMKPFMARYRGAYRSLGTVPFCELYRYYSQGSVFVLPSIEEGMAQVILQAMACGLPVICTPNTGGEDIIADGREGFIVPIRNPQAIREKILTLYDHEAVRKQMSEAAFQRVLSEFSWGRYGDQMVRAYKRILSADGREGAFRNG